MAHERMSELDWEIQQTLRMTKNLPDRERRLAIRGLRAAFANEYHYEQTQQRLFERRFRSLDERDGDEDDDIRAFSDNEQGVIALVDSCDWERIEASEALRWEIRKLHFTFALDKLREHPVLQDTLRAILRFRDREKIVQELGITPNAYNQRRFQIIKILKS